MTDDSADPGLRAKLTGKSEEAIGKLAQDLLSNPIVTGAFSRAFEAREKAAQAQEAAMGALNIPSAADLERLTRRVRSVSQRLEGIEDGVDRLDARLAELGNGNAAVRLEAIEERLAELLREVAGVAEAIRGFEPVPREQERLDVSAAD